MKKFTVYLLLTFTITLTYAKSYVSFDSLGGANFADENGNAISSGNAFFIIDTKANDFDVANGKLDLKLESGTDLSNQYFGEDNRYFIMKASTIENGFVDTLLSNFDISAFKENCQIGVLWFSDLDASNILADGQKYGFFTPSMAGGELSGGDSWILPSEGSVISLIMQTISAGGSLADIFGQMNFEVVPIPEPAAWAAIFGVCAIVIAVRKRK